MGVTATRSPEDLRISATRLQVHLYLKANVALAPLGLSDPAVTALATAAGSEAVDRLSMATEFWSDDPFLVAAAPALGISDARGAIAAASLL